MLLDLDSNKKMRDIHEKCHFVAWMDSETGVVKCANYCLEFCNNCVFKKSKRINNLAPSEEGRVTADEYCEQFKSPPPERYAIKKDFESYLTWLMKIASESKVSTVQLMAKTPGTCAIIRFNSLDAAYQWMQKTPGMNLKGIQADEGYISK